MKANHKFNGIKEKLLEKTYKQFRKELIHKKDLSKLDTLVSPDVMGYGTASDEKIFTIYDLRNFLMKEKEVSAEFDFEYKGKPVFKKIDEKGSAAIIVEEFSYKFSIKGAINELNGRITTAFEFKDGRWIVVHFHFAKVIDGSSGNDPFHLHEWKKKAEELEAKIKEKTFELEKKNKELQIEASLERIRTSAMAMRSSDELVKTSDVFFEQLKSLGIETIRTGIAIYDLKNETMDVRSRAYTGENSGSKILGIVPVKSHDFFLKCFTAWKKKEKVFAYELKGKDVKQFYKTMTSILSYPSVKNYNDKEFFYIFFFSEGSLNVVRRDRLNEEETIMLQRFANVFGLICRRFLDLQKAEEQTREAKIEAALEKVRASAMSLSKPGDILNICEVMFKEFESLGFCEMRNAMINIHDDEKESFLNYDYSNEMGKTVTHLYYNIHPVIEKQIKKIRSANDAFSETAFSGKEIKEWKDFRKNRGEKDDPRLDNITELYYYFYSIGNGSIGISTFSQISKDKLDLLKRFRNVFNLSYQRYADIALAEAQARESQIEASLERVRAKAMAMHNSSDLTDAAAMVFTELNKLGIKPIRSGVGIISKDTRMMQGYSATASADGGNLLHAGSMIMKGHREFEKQYDSWLKQENYFVELNGKELKSYYKFLSGTMFTNLSAKKSYNQIEYGHWLMFPEGFLFAWSQKKYSEEEIRLLERFKNIVALTFRRYLDLKKAESQVREAQIEAALERVRSKAMAMHQSSDLNMAVGTVLEELDKLNLGMERCGIGILDKEKRTADAFSASKSDEGMIVHVSGDESMDIHPLLKGAFESWLRMEEYTYKLEGKDLNNYYKALTETNFKMPETLSYFQNTKGLKQYYYASMFKFGGLFAFRETEFPEEAKKVMQRFANVFDLTYKRFLDIQKAEANAKEAQIETALERVRSKTMAMHNSNDVGDTVATMFDELGKLGIKTYRCGIGIFHEHYLEAWTAMPDKEGKTALIIGQLDMTKHPLLHGAYNGWKNKDSLFTYELADEDVLNYFEIINNQEHYPVKYDTTALPSKIFHNDFYFTEGTLYVFSLDPLSSEAKMILKRFASVFGQTYRRYLDLRKAEAQTKEAQIETALERVRARALAMQEPEELANVAQVLRDEMGILKIEELETCNIFIHDENSDKAECWYSVKDSRDGESKSTSGRVTLDLNQTSVGKSMFKFFNSEEKQVSIPVIDEAKEEFIKNIHSLVPSSREFYGKNIPDRTYHLYKFSSGAIGISSSVEVTNESWELLKRAASVFSLAYSRFKDLTQAKIDLQNLKEEKKRSDSLLLNILPEEIASELKQFGKSYARKHEQVSILFADIKGFSSIAENLSASELVTQLDECFRAFDYIVEKHGLEKIKTIGDAYICACGLPNPDPDNAAKTVIAALDMMDFIKGFAMTKKIQDLPAFEFRIGIHTGAVITGVVGLKKFTYDIWGDAVNMAARMEQHGEAGKINISESTYELIRDKFKCTHRGKIEAKNKGDVDMYFVEGML